MDKHAFNNLIIPVFSTVAEIGNINNSHGCMLISVDQDSEVVHLYG